VHENCSRYSKSLGAKFIDVGGKPANFVMGCYGLGVSRMLAASAEVLSTNTELRWPDRIAPFSACVLAPKAGSKEAKAAMDAALDFYDELNASVFADDVLLDDRDGVYHI
jgi:prolyl-tRNA synthetase